MLSGKFVLRLDPLLHKALKEEAKKLGESLNTLCLRKITQSAPSLHSAVIGAIVAEFNPLGIILFGSAARGEARQSSDIDLLIVLDSSVPIHRSLYQRWDQALPKDSKYSPQFVHRPLQEESIGSIWLESALEGEVLYDKEDLMKNELVQIRSKIAAGQYQRKTSHGQAYWIRKDLESYAK